LDKPPNFLFLLLANSGFTNKIQHRIAFQISGTAEHGKTSVDYPHL
jgi:hypothetical protein